MAFRWGLSPRPTGRGYTEEDVVEEQLEEGEVVGYWNGIPSPIKRVRLRLVGDGGHPEYWASEAIGTVRRAVRVRYGPQTFYLDDQTYDGWEKVTAGFGSPAYTSGHLYGEEVDDGSQEGQRDDGGVAGAPS